MTTRTGRDLHSLVPDSPPIIEPGKFTPRAPIPDGDGESPDLSAEGAPATGGGLTPPFTFISRNVWAEDVTTSDGAIFEQRVHIFTTFEDANGTQFEWPTGYTLPGGETEVVET